eukprot:gnl/MRDRNA2_/MRDRNA2_106379_c0_seq1.p1 gnl/MRDRNA2_/MRDRNA2_106379_c0~~gnl/MRDRNA2_/MRDRNA2_106379_c0_seq1.p1  ORF type:complete len:455 (-),score=106.52 gnl/MRDRNA2_/MRDRNA2_106379_c0_seq1:187-1551(-)
MSRIFAVAALALTATCCLGQQIVLDDLDSEVFSHARAHQGSYGPCLEDAYNGQFVHDWAREKGAVSATYSFNPPRDGCYLVEEHHPGNNQMCSRYLPKAAELHVAYCMGKTADVTIDQSRNGGTWNTIGKWPFFAGHKGSFTLSNSPQDSCSMGECFWVADAFRVTWVGPSCTEDEEVTKATTTEDAVQEQATLETTQAAGAEEGEQEQAASENTDMATSLTRGSISMAVTTSEGDHADLKLKLESLGVIEMALQTHFAYKSVNVLSLSVTSARRLGMAPGKIASNYNVDAVFEGQGLHKEISNGQVLTDLFQTLLDKHEAGIQVKSVTISFENPETGQPNDVSEKDPTAPLDLAVAVGLAAGVFVLLMSLLVWKKLANRKTTEQVVTDSISMYPDATKDPEKAVESNAEKKEEDMDVVSVSTAPPTDSEACSETGSATQAAADNSEMRSNASV